MNPDKSLDEALEAWRQRRASLAEVRSLAAAIGNQHYAPGIPALVQLLNHEDEIVRYNAAVSLAFEFHHTPAGEKLLSMLEKDPDEDCRDVGAVAMGTLYESTRDRRIMAALAEAALNDSDEYVRASAYKSLQIVNGVSRDERLEMLRDQSLSVDPARVQAILQQVSE
jgi:HEAT repeat protein